MSLLNLNVQSVLILFVWLSHDKKKINKWKIEVKYIFVFLNIIGPENSTGWFSFSDLLNYTQKHE